jgi:cell division protein FtsB
MLILLIISVILGGIVSAVTGIGFLFWVVSVIFFIFGLPGVLIGGFIHSENEYAQDRADYRELMKDLAEDERMLRHEIEEDERMDRYIDALENTKYNTNIYFDNRQIHINNHKPRREKSLNRGYTNKNYEKK